MADIAVTAVQAEPIDPSKAEIYEFIAGATILQGQAVYMITTGKVGLADADGSAPTPQFLGIACNGGGAGQAISVLKKGRIGGFAVSALTPGDRIYLSTTAGALATTQTGTMASVGRVVPMSDSTPTLVAYIEANWAVPYA